MPKRKHIKLPWIANRQARTTLLHVAEVMDSFSENSDGEKADVEFELKFDQRGNPELFVKMWNEGCPEPTPDPDTCTE